MEIKDFLISELHKNKRNNFDNVINCESLFTDLKEQKTKIFS